MISHWSERRAQIAAQIAAQRQLFIGCDFDGTLAPIVDQPDAAALAPGAREVLAALAVLPGLHCAIVSGRALHDVRKRVGLDELIYVGNHGLEMAGGSLGEWQAPMTCVSRMELRSALSRLRNIIGNVFGVLIEDKRLTGSIHYRMAPAEKHEAIGRAVELVAGEYQSLTVRAGHKVWELRPLLAWNKGAAVRRLLARVAVPDSAAICLGDDNTDETMFRAVPDAVSLRVGEPLTETAARFRLNNVSDTITFLSFVLGVRTNSPSHAAHLEHPSVDTLPVCTL